MKIKAVGQCMHAAAGTQTPQYRHASHVTPAAQRWITVALPKGNPRYSGLNAVLALCIK